MRRRFCLHIITLIAGLGSAAAQAQLDSSSAILLRPSGKNVAPESLDTSRYKVRMPESHKNDDDLDEKPGTYIPSPVPSRQAKSKSTKDKSATAAQTPSAATPLPATQPTLSAEPTQPVVTAAAGSAPAAENHPVTEQVRELILGGSPEDIDEYRKQIHPQDPRANVLSISFAPAYFYEASSSEYSFRRYITNGPGFGATMNLWVTPFFGVQSKYFSSVTASVKSGSTDMVPVDVTTFEAGLRFRKHFGYSRKASSLSWGIDYHDAADKISRDSTSNVGRRSSGLSLALEVDVPNSTSYAHAFEASIQPRLHHSEPATMSEAKSGTKNETNALSLSVGGHWVLDRRNQIFWKSQYSVERNLFQGEASDADPLSGQTPNGVSVTNSQIIFYFGFRWGS